MKNVRILLAALALALVLASSAQAASLRPAGSWGGEWNRPLFTPRGVAFDQQGRMHALDTRGNRVVLFDSERDPVGAFPLFGSGDGIGGPASEKAGIAVDGAGATYIADGSRNRGVVKYGADGRQLARWDLGSGERIRDVTWDRSTGSVVVLSDGEVQVFDTEGNLRWQWSGFGPARGVASAPTVMSADGEGLLVVATAELRRLRQREVAVVTVHTFDMRGRPVSMWETTGRVLRGGGAGPEPAGFSSIAATPEGLLYALGGGAMRVFGGDGELHALRDAPGMEQVDAGPALGIYVSDARAHKVRLLNRRGQLLDQAGYQSHDLRGDGLFATVGSLAVAWDGTVLATDPLNERIQAFDPAGRFIRAWRLPNRARRATLIPGRRGESFVFGDPNGKVIRYSAEGSRIRPSGWRSPLIPAASVRPGRFYAWSGDTVIRLSGTGRVTDRWRSQAAGRIRDIAAGPKGRVWVLGGYRVFVHGRGGELLRSWALGTVRGRPAEGGELAVDGRGRSYVLARRGRHLLQYSAGGGRLTVTRTSRARALAVSADGTVYVAHDGGGRSTISRYVQGGGRSGGSR